MRTESYFQGYLATSVRLDKKPKCTPGNKPCGDRCIPTSQKCHVGETEGLEDRSIAQINRGTKRIAIALLNDRDKEVDLYLDELERTGHKRFVQNIRLNHRQIDEMRREDYLKTFDDVDPKLLNKPISKKGYAPVEAQEIVINSYKRAKANDPLWRRDAKRGTTLQAFFWLGPTKDRPAPKNRSPQEMRKKEKARQQMGSAVFLGAIAAAGIGTAAYVHHTAKQRGES